MSIKIKLPDGRVIPSSNEIVAEQVTNALLKQGRHVNPMEHTASSTLPKGELKRFNNSRNAAKEEYVLEELKVQLSGYTEGEKLTKKGVIALFNAIIQNTDANKYYVGITCDPDRRAKEHDAEFIAVISCPNKDKANEMEKTLDRKGYDAGDAAGNVHDAKSDKVYIYKKIPRKTKE